MAAHRNAVSEIASGSRHRTMSAISHWIARSPSPVVVTLVGWLILAKGLLLSFVTPEAMTQLLERMQYGEHYSLYIAPYIAPSLVIGLYLTWAGFTAPPSNAD
jgi:hypothetical protein